MAGVIKVAIIEDHREIREGLEFLINGTAGFRALPGYPSMELALSQIATAFPDVVLVDLGLPGMSGIDGLRELKRRFASLPLLVLTVYDDDQRIFDALCAGACGYLLKKTPPARLLESIREVVEGGAPMSPDVARRVVALFRTVRPEAQSQCDLTPHELRILKLIVDGHNYRTAAGVLKVSVNTISFHMRNIYTKLQVHSKSEAVAKVLREKILS